MSRAASALACAAVLAVLAWAVTHTGQAEWADGIVLRVVAEQNDPLTRALASISSVLTGAVAIGCGVGALAVAWTRRRGRLAVAVIALVALSHLTTQVLKSVLEREHLSPGMAITPNSFPSGHTTLALACACALLLALPPRAGRWAVPLATAWVTAVGVGVVAASWHRPSDVLGACLVVAFWLCVISAAAVRSSAGTGSVRTRWLVWGPVACVVAGAGAVLAADADRGAVTVVTTLACLGAAVTTVTALAARIEP